MLFDVESYFTQLNRRRCDGLHTKTHLEEYAREWIDRDGEFHEDSYILNLNHSCILLCGSSRSFIQLWNVHEKRMIEANLSGVESLLLLNENNILCCSPTAPFMIYDWSTAEVIAKCSEDSYFAKYDQLILINTKFLICIHKKKGKPIVLDIENGFMPVRKFNSSNTSCVHYGFNKDVFLIGTSKGDIKTCNLKNGVVTSLIKKAHKKGVQNLLLIDRLRLASVGVGQSTINIWRCDTGSLLFVLDGHEDFVTRLRHFGSLICSCSDDNSILLWDVYSKSKVLKITGSAMIQSLRSLPLTIPCRFLISPMPTRVVDAT
ncbi:Btrc [Acrasis kona]|uniref:Btrc n=1 Tax=Acrasis kona TaxID=1008807 RepID=A0AAW2YN52_9EUKA